MNIRLLPLSLVLLLISGPASAACYADYKAKRDNPLRLHYGVIELSDAVCQNTDDVRAEIAERIAGGNWTLLNVLSTFGPEGLKERQDSAGRFYLRF